MPRKLTQEADKPNPKKDPSCYTDCESSGSRSMEKCVKKIFKNKYLNIFPFFLFRSIFAFVVSMKKYWEKDDTYIFLFYEKQSSKFGRIFGLVCGPCGVRLRVVSYWTGIL